MEKIECQFRINKIALNSIATFVIEKIFFLLKNINLFLYRLMSIIDTSGNCMLIDMESKEPRDDITNFKKSDVWNVVWANVNCFLFILQ
jgi:hypothetical protein